jgi:hypothetical protein
LALIFSPFGEVIDTSIFQVLEVVLRAKSLEVVLRHSV